MNWLETLKGKCENVYEIRSMDRGLSLDDFVFFDHSGETIDISFDLLMSSTG